MNKRTTIICLIYFILSCSDREPLNPLDPNNPYTGGKPTGLKLLPIQNTVKILWSPVDVNDLTLYAVYKGTTGSEMFKLWDVSPDSTFFLDTNVSFYETYTYAIEAHTETYSSVRSDTVQITVGPFNIYAADFWNSSIRMISWDGNHLITTKYVASPRQISLRKIDNRFWVANYYDRSLLLISTDLVDITSVVLPDHPLDLDMNQDQGIAYVATRDGLIISVDMENEIFSERSLGLKLNWDTQSSFDHVNRGLWLTIPDSGMVLYIPIENETSTIKYFEGFNYPSAVAAHDNGWVADRTGLHQIKPDGEIETIVTNIMVTDVSIDTLNRFCFYTGYNSNADSWIAGRINLNTLAHEIMLDDTYPYLYNIFSIPREGKAEFLVQQSYFWKIFRFNDDGTPMGELDGFNGRIAFQIY